MFTYKNILIIIMTIVISTSYSYSSLQDVTDDNVSTQSVRVISEIESSSYTIRHLRSDVAYGSCIVAGCVIGAGAGFAPFVKEDVILFGLEGLTLFLSTFGWEVGTGIIAGGTIGCCVGAAWKAKIISGCACGGPTGATSLVINESNPERNV